MQCCKSVRSPPRMHARTHLHTHAGSRDTSVIVWDAGSAQAGHTLQGHTYQVTGVAALPGGQVVSAALDKCVA
jgi:WD40 repeat protein